METADLTYPELEKPKAILKKMRDVNPVDLSAWWKRQAELHGTYNALEAQLRVEAHRNHAVFFPGPESAVILTEAVEREMQELLDLDLN
jgi:hypothetical protein